MSSKSWDIVIVGAGIVGAATAEALSRRFPRLRLCVLDKEAGPAQHQTGRNSGVIHAGVYYPSDSLKARYCREGLERTYAFCQQYDIAVKQTGKILVATNDLEVERLGALYERCKDSGLAPRWLDSKTLCDKEPNVSGRAGMLVTQTGITSYEAITAQLLALVAARGGEIDYGQTVTDIQEYDQSVSISLNGGRAIEAGLLINCAGLHADRLIRLAGANADFQIIPFRGEYYQLPAKFNDIVKHLIYPVPDPAYPFLGVHLTRMIDGSVTVGPNAVLSLAREGYGKLSIDVKDVAEMLRFKGFWPLMTKNIRAGWQEMRNSLLKQAYLRQVTRYCPQIKREDLLPYRAGIRAQAVNRRGELLHDFQFVETTRTLHVGNAPSPAATSAMPIANAIVDKLADKL